MNYEGMKISFVRIGETCYRVEILVPYSDGKTQDVVPLGYASRINNKWVASTMRWAVVATRIKRRQDCVYPLYCQRFGNPEIKKKINAYVPTNTSRDPRASKTASIERARKFLDDPIYAPPIGFDPDDNGDYRF